MYLYNCFIRKNSKKLQKKLQKIGYKICVCCNFKGSVWLNNLIDNGTIHGIGFVDEISPFNTTEEMLNLFLKENIDPKYKKSHCIDCGDNEKLFLAIVALRDDSDINQWFRFEDTKIFKKCDLVKFDHKIFDYELPFSINENVNKWHKASPEELIKYFNNEFKK